MGSGSKPGDHPDFFRFPAPQGRSRESTIKLDKYGRFSHDGEPFQRDDMTIAFSRWIQRHPENGRYILSNGYDWTYFTVEDTPFFVVGVRVCGEGQNQHVQVRLSDGSHESLAMETLTRSEDGGLYCLVKEGSFEAAFQRTALHQLAAFLREGDAGQVLISFGDRTFLVQNRHAPGSERPGA